MKEKIENLKGIVTNASANPDFVHHEWFVDLHLKIVEKISLELCRKHKEANENEVLVLTWVHDYPKILITGGTDKVKEHDPNFFRDKIRNLLNSIGFEKDFVEKVIRYQEIFESKMEFDLSKAPLEVQIVSSADGAAHFFGPFFSIFWKENADKSVKDLIESNKNKIEKDWNRKIVLPEVRTAIEQRYGFWLEQVVDLQDNLLNI